ncbi:MAG: hypothetical protein ACOYO7_08490, partial [Phycisphaerales bacterium]
MKRIPLAAALAVVAGCAAPTRTPPPPLVDRAPAATKGPDPIAHDRSRAEFDALPASKLAGAPVSNVDRPSAMPLLEMTLPPAEPAQVARIEVADQPTAPPSMPAEEAAMPMPDDVLRALDARPRVRPAPVVVVVPEPAPAPEPEPEPEP